MSIMEWINSIKSSFQNERESESYDSTNGLILSNFLLPEEIFLSIFNYVDARTLLNCKLVCINWNEIIQSKSFWRLKLQPLKKTVKENIPWFVYYALVFRNVFDTNLLKNTNGEDKLKNWKIIMDGGSRWVVEDIPEGADPLPANIPDFNDRQSCFATSYMPCIKSQLIYLEKYKLLHRIIREYQPTITVSEWFSGRFDCGCTYKMVVNLLDKNRKLIDTKEENRRVEQWEGNNWSKVEMSFKYDKDKASKISYIEFCHEGCDTQYWMGHYGSKMAGAVLKLSYDSI